MPDFPKSVYVHPSASVMGNVTVGEHSSLWPHCSIRGDFEHITIGAHTSIQDCAVLHAAPGVPTKVGDFVTVAHGAVLHGCVVEDCCLISMHAVVQDGCVIGAGSIVGAGAILTERTQVPPGSIVVGVPGKIKPGREGQLEVGRNNALSYSALAKNYLDGKETISGEDLVRIMAELRKEAGLE